ncbi:Meiotically up-regulated protein [Escovopsis weberi]|uniref:Meiotically up-regulated protein n=1 Tax=Escovopsis weberi TaxID=150374 RepID=A0A0M8N900_ESCWE|nr:Meiotically up-regulated protein [Escovopsis weberi]
MTYAGTSPEAMIRRTDSKPVETTCHGLNGNGQHCRRALKADAIVGPNDATDEALFCHQHKDQARPRRPAPSSAAAAPKPKPKPPRIHGVTITEQRFSVDSLASLTDRLGFMRIQDPPGTAPYMNGGAAGYQRKKKRSLLCCCFCLPFDDEDFPDPPRPQQLAPLPPQHHAAHPQGHKPPPAELIPRDLPHETIAKLEKEVAKGFSEADEPGYIYIFWLKRDGDAAPPVPIDAASVRAVMAGSGGGANHFSTDTTLLIKIGRAVNVHKRMKEWTSQCGFSIELLRSYPHVPSAEAEAGVEPRPTPHANKVENLVHKELTGMGMRAPFEKCEACGARHQEWFRMDYTTDSIRKVDGVIRKWIEWDYKMS